MEEGCGAGATGEGDHQQSGRRLAWRGAGGGELAGALQHLAIAHRPGTTAIKAPLGAEDFDGPTEAGGGPIDGGIGSAGTAMEKALHRPAGGGQSEGRGDLIGWPIEIPTATGHDHQGAKRWSRQSRRRRRQCGGQRKGNHGPKTKQTERKMSAGKGRISGGPAGSHFTSTGEPRAAECRLRRADSA
jgi:hypothetical protein